MGIFVALGAVGCSNNDEDPNAYLNAPEANKKITNAQAGADRGMTPEQMKAMAEPPRGPGAGKR